MDDIGRGTCCAILPVQGGGVHALRAAAGQPSRHNGSGGTDTGSGGSGMAARLVAALRGGLECEHV